MSTQNFKKKKQPQQSTTSLWESFTSNVTNLAYGFTKFSTQLKQKIFSDRQQEQQRYIKVQGTQYKNRLQARKHVKQIIWFSYRKGFNIKNQFTSDVGWGCLIRVGQMALASALIKYFKSQSQMGFLDFQDQMFAIIASFSDVQGRQQKYSLNKVMQIAQQQFGQKAGQWFNLSRISYCLRTMQNKYPMKGSQNLQVVYFDQCLNIPTILNVQHLLQCKCSKKKIVCQKCHRNYKPQYGQLQSIKSIDSTMKTLYSDDSLKSGMKKKNAYFQTSNQQNTQINLSQQNRSLYIYRHKRLKRDMMVILSTRACRSINDQKAIFTLLDLHICLGIMTGFPKKAIFVVGRQEGRLIYLDPHYVQPNFKFQQGKKQSYFCKQYLLTSISELDPSMAFCFYIQNLYELQILVQTIQRINRNYKDSLSIAVDNYNYPFNPEDYQQKQQDSMSLVSFSL